ncbi:caspase family protein [Bosea sp. Root483D1]|uniref:caspase family protein n=1 Tax=Bosea sp. Root483D1 TaxID=1736544 RepID=UPI001FCD6075|nr:caspase family protein [Bosea sp. Root483D1]
MPASAQTSALSDNAESIAMVIGNKSYKQTSTVDFAHNDAEAIKAYLIGTLGFREQNVFLLKDATLGELNQAFGSEANPQGGRLWRSAVEGRSNVFVYYSGHGVPDLATRQPFLLPQDGNPNASESGYAVQTLYRNLELVRQKIGPQRQLIVMIDACFTGETGRKGESLLAVSAPGFTPAKPRTGGGIVKLVATSGTTPANWDGSQKLGLFTSRFLMGAAGLARPAGASETGPLAWSDLQRYLKETVEVAARRDSGREQVPEIDLASIALPVAQPVPAVARAVAQARDEANWQRAKAAGEPSALEAYVARCGETCGYREAAMALLLDKRRSTEAVSDEQNWVRLGGSGKYEDYLKGCGTVCAYRSLAEGYLGRRDASRDPRVQECDELAGDPNDPDRREGVKGVKFGRLDTRAAIAACRQAAEAQPEVRRLSYQLGRAYDKAERYKDALAAYDKAAAAGSAAAMNNLGTLHENGQGGKVDLQKAFASYERAAGTGNAIAMSNVGRMLQYGRGRARDESGALRWYQKAAEAGDAFSIAKLVPAYLEGRPGFPKNPQKGFDLFRQAADKGDPIAMVSMATLIDNGFGTYFPGANALQMLMKALEKGEAGAAAVSSSDVSDQKLKPDTVRALQRAAQKADHYSGAIDGRFNPVFVRALDSYARSLEQER